MLGVPLFILLSSQHIYRLPTISPRDVAPIISSLGEATPTRRRVRFPDTRNHC